MHKMKLDDSFNTRPFLISECNLAGFFLLKIITATVSGFLHMKNLLNFPSDQVFSGNFRFHFKPFFPC